MALAEAGDAARGATAYVTLEPCAHQGETPPCANALMQAGVARVVSAVQDPDPRVSGKGIAMLWDGGVKVTTGVLEKDAAYLNAGFFLKVRENRPLVTLKVAQSLDGKTATVSGQSKWITGPAARSFGHLLRAKHDAILIGVETALADDPELTCRIGGLEDRSPIRVVLDSRLRLDEGSKLVKTAKQIPTILFTTASGGSSLIARGVEVIRTAKDARGRPEISAVLKDLAKRGVTRLLVEGGASVHASFLDRGLADRLEIFRAPVVLGASGHSAIGALAALDLDEASRFVSRGKRVLGPDLLESFAATA
jgi:diaminohydroxyphosphoribosylaminopyrimidine deaminase/5-amino-6-(5-phosphoribosylamino)uracil reductase